MTNQERPDTRPRCGGTPGKPSFVVRVGVHDLECSGCLDCAPAPDTQSGGRPTVAVVADEGREADPMTALAYETFPYDEADRRDLMDALVDAERIAFIRGYIRARDAAESTIAGLREQVEGLRALVSEAVDFLDAPDGFSFDSKWLLRDNLAAATRPVPASPADALCAGRREMGYPCRLPESHHIHRPVESPPPGPPSHWHPFVAPAAPLLGVSDDVAVHENYESTLLQWWQAADRELAALSSDKQTLMTAVTHWRKRAERAEATLLVLDKVHETESRLLHQAKNRTDAAERLTVDMAEAKERAEARVQGLTDALQGWVTAAITKVCPHGNSARYPTSAWFCDDCLEAARAALAAPGDGALPPANEVK